jgi:hypothetical protein
VKVPSNSCSSQQPAKSPFSCMTGYGL